MDSEKQKVDIEEVMDHLSRSAEVPERVLLAEPSVLNGLQHVLFQNTLGSFKVCNSPGNLEDGMTGRQAVLARNRLINLPLV